MKISDLTKNPANPRMITPAKRKMLIKAMKRFGDLSGIVYNRKTKRLVGGHQRRDVFEPDTAITITKKYSKPTSTGTVAEGYVIAKGERFAYREVFWDDKTEKAANIAANKGAGDWDTDKLGEWLKELGSFDVDFDLQLTRFDPAEIKDLIGIEVEGYTRSTKHEETGVDEDDVPDMPEAVEPKTKLGDIYQLGRHRLMCGDSTSIDAVEKLMNGEKADMVFTDPPYGGKVMGKAGGRDSGFNRSINKIKRNVEFISNFQPSAFISVLETLRPGSIYIFTNLALLQDYLDEKSKILVWFKGHGLPSVGNYNSDIEFIVFKKNEGAIFNNGISSLKYSHLIEMPKRDKSLHPTMKPVALIENCIRISSNESVLDLFGGSGSTLIACEKTNRKCFMMEIDPHYCDVIVARWEVYTGLKAKLISSDKTKKPVAQARRRETNAACSA